MTDIRLRELKEMNDSLDNTPPSLEYSMSRAKVRYKNYKSRKFFTVPIGSVALVMAIFVALVNASSPFARACSQVPFFKELMEVVAFSPSLKAAIENNYVQPLDIRQSKDGVELAITHIIGDSRRLEIFYTITSEKYENIDIYPTFLLEDGRELEGYSASFGQKNEGIRKISIELLGKDLPDRLTLVANVKEVGRNESEDVITSFTVPLNITTLFGENKELLQLDKPFMLDTGNFVLQKMAIYPLHMSIDIGSNEENDFWLSYLDFYFENEKGEVFNPQSNGITAYGNSETPQILSYRAESPFFSQNKSLDLVITGYGALDKGEERVKFDLRDNSHGKLPEGVEFLGVEEQSDGSRHMLFTVGQSEVDGVSHSVWKMEFFGETGNSYPMGMSYMTRTEDKQSVIVALPADFTENTLYLAPTYSKIREMQKPVRIKIK